MFIASGPALVAAQCKAGIVGSFPALNARPAEQLDVWLTDLQRELADYQAAHPDKKVGPIAVNQIVHQSNDRLAHDVEVCVKHQVPIIISSLRAPPQEMLDAVHAYGGIVLHDVVSIRHAEKALEAGVDGLILVAAGAGGHAGALSPFALVGEVRKFFDGPIALSGSIATGDAILAAQAMGADFAYIGSRWLATQRIERQRRLPRRDRRIGGGRHRLHQPVHRRARQLPEEIDRGGRAGSGQPAGVGQEQDEFRLRQRQGLARHLGRGPGRRPDGRRADRGGDGGALDAAVSGGAGAVGHRDSRRPAQAGIQAAGNVQLLHGRCAGTTFSMDAGSHGDVRPPACPHPGSPTAPAGCASSHAHPCRSRPRTVRDASGRRYRPAPASCLPRSLSAEHGQDHLGRAHVEQALLHVRPGSRLRRGCRRPR